MALDPHALFELEALLVAMTRSYTHSNTGYSRSAASALGARLDDLLEGRPVLGVV